MMLSSNPMVTSESLPPKPPDKGENIFGEQCPTFAEEPPKHATDVATSSNSSNPTSVAKPAKPVVPNTKGWMTREESARLLSVTIQTVKNYEKRGHLHPLPETRVNPKNGRKYTVMVLDPAEILNVKKTVDARPDQETRTWWSREQARTALSVSTQTLKNYEKRGLLHPVSVRRADQRGHEQSMIVYDPKELAKVPKGHQLYSRDSGELAAKAFIMFEDGRNNREVVIKLRITPDEARELREKWLDEGGAGIVINPTAKQALEKMLGAFNDVADLVALVTKKLRVL